MIYQNNKIATVFCLKTRDSILFSLNNRIRVGFSVQLSQRKIRLILANASVLGTRGHILGRLATAGDDIKSVAGAAVVQTRTPIQAHIVALAIGGRRKKALFSERESGELECGTPEAEVLFGVAVVHHIGPVATIGL